MEQKYNKLAENLPQTFPREIYTGEWTTGHIQGIALDKDREYIYYSFTTVLVKADLKGNVVGTVTGLTGHLGCIAFNCEDNTLWGSIEYKHDIIGRGIMKNTGAALPEEDAFYAAIFDVEKIDRIGMDAEADGVMTAVYLPDVAADFSAHGAKGKEHRYGCSGIDGMGFGPKFGADKNSPYMLYVAYGVYGDTDRHDNDHQVILEYDWRSLKLFAKPLTQLAPHHSGDNCQSKLFFYTGNTNWGIQNLEYDSFLDVWLLAVYYGSKPQFANPPMFAIDRETAPFQAGLKGLDGEEGLLLTSAKLGTLDTASGAYGIGFPWGQTGLYSLGGGYYYFSFDRSEKRDGVTYHASTVKLCRFTGTGEMFEVVGLEQDVLFR